MQSPARWRIRFHVGLVMGALLLAIALGGTLLAIAIHEADDAAERTADAMFQRVSRDVVDRTDALMQRALRAAAIGADLPALQLDRQDDAGAVAYLAGVLTADDAIQSGYVGYADGSFLQVIAVRNDPRILEAVEAPPATDLVLRTISASNPRQQRWRFVNGTGTLLSERTDSAGAADPRQQNWYREAMERAALTLSEPYLPDLRRSRAEPAVTASRPTVDGKGVIGIDLTLRELSYFLDDNPVSANGGVILSDSANRLLAASRPYRPNAPPLADIRTLRSGPYPLLAAGESGRQGDLLLHHDLWAFGIRNINIAVVAPVADFTGHIAVMRTRTLMGAALVALIVLPLIYWTARRVAAKLEALADEAERLRNWDFEGEVPRGWIVREFDAVAEGFAVLKRSLAERTRNMEESQLKLHELIRMGVSLAAERDNDQLIENILIGAKDLANADGGSIYIRTDDDKLKFQVILNDSLGIKISRGQAATFPPVPMYDAEGRPNRGNVVSHCVHERATVNIDDVYGSADFDFSGTRAFDARNGYRSTSILTVPLMPRDGEVLGALQLINPRGPDGTSTTFALGTQRFVEALAAQAGMTLHNRILIDGQEKLIDSLITIIADAVDAKSPYTGGHCARVPELAQMLVEAACESHEGPLADFRFDTEEEWREFRIGSWLHDCGKVTTPEYVVDKATKLETIFNRIHEVRTRFEVLLRDAQIRRLEGLRNGRAEEDVDRELAEEKQRLAADFAFIAECNIGGEFMAPDRIARMKEIASRTWMRHFDDRLGLSHGELSTLQDVPPAPLPVLEKLLADKPEHIIPRTHKERFLDPSYGFKITVPEHLYNRGEVYNLQTSRGTLTEEERFKINEHIIQTIMMLDHLPFPKHLKRVPEYAGTHHETMIGTGYPRRLTGEQMSVPARVMVVADIFEALTAADRPYKKPKTLSESIKILSFFEKDRHIDPHIFRLFLKSGVYRKYAERFLSPEQIDEVDIERYLAAPIPA